MLIVLKGIAMTVVMKARPVALPTRDPDLDLGRDPDLPDERPVLAATISKKR